MKRYEEKLVNKFKKCWTLKFHLYNKDFVLKILNKKIILLCNNKKIYTTLVDLWDNNTELFIKIIRSILATYKTAYQLYVHNKLYYYDEKLDTFVESEDCKKFLSCNDNEYKAIKAMQRFVDDGYYYDWFMSMKSVYQYNYNEYSLKTYYDNVEPYKVEY